MHYMCILGGSCYTAGVRCGAATAALVSSSHALVSFRRRCAAQSTQSRHVWLLWLLWPCRIMERVCRIWLTSRIIFLALRRYEAGCQLG